MESKVNDYNRCSSKLPHTNFLASRFDCLFFNSQTFTTDARLIGDNGRILRMGLREAKQPFYLARMMVGDEIKSRTKLTQVSFSEGGEKIKTLGPSSVVLFSKARSQA